MVPMLSRPAVLGVLLPLVVAAPGFAGLVSAQVPRPGDATSSGPVTRDSAGVTIVYSAAPVWGAGEGWTIDPDPVLILPVQDSPSSPLRFLQAPSQPHRLPDGRIMIMDRSSKELRIYGPDGALLRSIGGEGTGPGQFSGGATYSLLPGDSILTFELQGRRMTWFDGDGEVVRTQVIPTHSTERPLPWTNHGRPEVAARLGTLLGSWVGGPGQDGPSEHAAGERDRSVGYTFLDFRTGEHTAVQEIFTWPAKGTRMPWRPIGTVRLVDDLPGLVGTQSWHWELREYGLDGALSRIVRAAVPRLSREQVADSMRAQGGPTAADRFLEVGPDSLPAIAYEFDQRWSDKLMSDGEGRLWVRRATWEVFAPGPTGGTRIMATYDQSETFDVVDADRRWLGSVEVPAGIGSVREVGPDYVLAVWGERAYQVTQLRIYRIDRGDGEPSPGAGTTRSPSPPQPSIEAARTVLPSPSGGTPAFRLTREDSVQARVVVLDHLMSEGPVTIDPQSRVWVRPYWTLPTPESDWLAVYPTPAERRGIAERAPGVRIVPEGVAVFRCPGGGVPIIPLGGCPVREDGIVVEFGDLRPQEDGSLVALGTRLHTNPGSGRTSSSTWVLSLTRDADGVWTLARVLSVSSA